MIGVYFVHFFVNLDSRRTKAKVSRYIGYVRTVIVLILVLLIVSTVISGLSTFDLTVIDLVIQGKCTQDSLLAGELNKIVNFYDNVSSINAALFLLLVLLLVLDIGFAVINHKLVKRRHESKHSIKTELLPAPVVVSYGAPY